MSNYLQSLQNEAAADVAESGIDMNVVVKGGGRLLPAGYAFGRLVEYVELGNQPQEYQGKAKDPALEFMLGFALHGEGYTNEDGTPYILRTFGIALSRNEKARAFKLFRALNWKGTAKSFGQLLGETFLVKIVHKPKSATDASPVARLDYDGFLPPLDPVTKAPYPIPAVPDETYRLFLWSRPTKEAWARLYVEGTFDDGDSKNKVQEKILAALDFQGSALQSLLSGGAQLALPVSPAPAAAPVAAQAAAAVLTAATAPAMPAIVAPVVPALPKLPV